MVKGFSPVHLFAVLIIVSVGGLIVAQDYGLRLAPCTPPNCFGNGTSLGQVSNVSKVNPIPDGDNQVKVKFPLFTDTEKLYLNDTINKVVQQLGAQQLPTVLKSGTFKGNVNSAYTQEIVLGRSPNSLPRIEFNSEPEANNTPADGIKMGIGNIEDVYTYGLLITFSSPVDFTSPASKGKTLNIAGKTFKIDQATNATRMILVNVNNANDRLVLLWGDGYVRKGINEQIINGTMFDINLAEDFTNLDAFGIVVEAQNPNGDFAYKIPFFFQQSLKEQHYTDPVFGTFKLVFEGMKNSGLYAKKDSELGETNDILAIGPTGSDQIEIEDFRDWRNFKRDIFWYDNSTGHPARLAYGSGDSQQIRVIEATDLHMGNRFVLGNNGKGRMFEVDDIVNYSNGYFGDYVQFTDSIDYTTYKFYASSEGIINATIDGELYVMTYSGSSTSPDPIVRINFMFDSPYVGMGIFFPTIKTLMGAKMMLYQPTPINLYTIPTFYGELAGRQFILMLPNGESYSNILFTPLGNGKYQVNGQGFGILDTLNVSSAVTFPIGELEYEVRGTGIQNRTMLYLHDVQHQNIKNPALVFFEEADDSGKYEALIVKIKGSATNNSMLEVADIQRTWSEDSEFKNRAAYSGGDVAYLSQSRYGSVTSLQQDVPFQDPTVGGIIYPDKQSEALVYIQEI